MKKTQKRKFQDGVQPIMLSDKQRENVGKVQRRIKFLKNSSTYMPYHDMRKNRWEILDMSEPIEVSFRKSNVEKDHYYVIYVLAKQKHSYKVNGKLIKVVDYAVFSDLLYPGTVPSDKYYGTLKSARKAFNGLKNG